MRKIIFTIVLIGSFYAASSQRYVDSLLNIIRTSKNVQTRLEAARYYTWFYAFKPIDSVFYSGDQLIKIGAEHNSPDMKAVGKSFHGYAYNLIGETYKALSANIEALKLAEKVSHPFLYAFIYISYGQVYAINPPKAIFYYKKTLDYLKTENSLVATMLKRSALNNIGVRYNAIKQYDSALFYLKQVEEIYLQLKNTINSYGGHYAAIGNAYLGLNQPRLAHAYYHENLEMAKKLNEQRTIDNAHVGLAKYHKAVGNLDSALACLDIVFTNKDMAKLPSNWIMDPALMYYELHKAKGNDKEALKYIEIHRTARLKADSTAQLQQMQTLSFEEDQRQQTILLEKQKEKEERAHNLQYAAIALGSVSFIILFFVLSHSIIANQRLIKFLGILALLIVFEFLNLLLHPYIANFTHHSPAMMLGIMVCLAALLIPFHHRLEHWITHKLVEKNKRIRLAAARKTIAQLEKRGES